MYLLALLCVVALLCGLITYTFYSQNCDDPSVVGQRIKINSPYILASSTAEEVSFHIMVERESISEVSTFKSSLIHLIASYFIFDIAYPKQWYATFIFLQHHLFGLTDKQRVPPNLIEMVTILKRMDTL